MGVREFDVAQHQPHPPGYPVFIVLGRLGTALYRWSGAAAPEVRGLAVWSALGGSVLLIAIFFLARFLFPDNLLLPLAAMLMSGAAPLVWFNALRPLSDTAGLAVAFVSLAMLTGASMDDRTAWSGDRIRLLCAGAFIAGLSGGLRSQMIILTMPLLAYIVLAPGLRMRGALRVAALASAAAGILIWVIPLLVESGGPHGYLQALRSQAGEDFGGVVMLWTHPTPRAAAQAALNTFVLPWESAILAGVVLSLAVAGFLFCARYYRRSAVILAIVFGPYLFFQLLFQETMTTRYALPLVPAVVLSMAVVLAHARGWAALMGSLAIMLSSASHAVPAGLTFGRTPSPIFAVLSEMRALAADGTSPVIGVHRRIWSESWRVRQWAGPLQGRFLRSPAHFEWLEVTRVWRDGYDGPTWFLANPRRTDLALIDSEYRRSREFRWPFDAAVYVGGSRPSELDWHIFDRPGWFLEQGWALTPEIAGVSDREGWGPHRQPSVGWIRRRADEMLMVLGGRHLGSQKDPSVQIAAVIDGRVVATLDVHPGYFLDFVPLAAGALAGEGRYAKLTVTATSRDSGTTPPVGLEQFNLQSADVVQFGFDDGWFEPEYNPETGKSWRWMSDSAFLHIHHAGKDVVLSIRGESPLRYFDHPPLLRVISGETLLGEFRPDADFDLDVRVPAAVLGQAGGRVVLQSSERFVPAERGGSPDRRRLALRIYSVRVKGDSPFKGTGALKGQSP